MPRNTARLGRTLHQLASDAPQVVALRMAAFAAPGAMASTQAWSELQRMVWEKQAAALESGMAQWQAAASATQAFWLAVMLGRVPAWPAASTVAGQARAALRPYQVRASANARRLRARR